MSPLEQLSLKSLSEIGDREEGRRVIERMAAGSPAYQSLIEETLKKAGKKELRDLDWSEIPIITKRSFYAAHPWRDILPRDSYRDIYSVIRSSGTTDANGASRGFFWPQLRSQDVKMGPVLQAQIVENFQLAKRRTLVIIGLSLGSWAGGEQFSFMFKALALSTPLPLVVFSPGNQHLEILEIIEKAHEEFDQILIALCPSAIFYLERLAIERGTPLPMKKICFVVTGEPFTEELRSDLKARAGKEANELTMLSVYGSADTGIIGFESAPLIQIRQLLSASPELAAKLGFTSASIPNLYHLQPNGGYFEVIQDELVITKWQGLPLLRYNLEDRVRMMAWNDLCLALAAEDTARQAIWSGLAQLPLPDVISVSGRSKGCVFLCGSNIFESMLQEVLMESSLRSESTGAFVAWSEVVQGQQVLIWQIELKPGCATPTGERLDAIYREFVDRLGVVQPEFKEDYEKFYRPFEAAGLRIFRFHFTASPGLSDHQKYASSVKRKIIIENGPIS